MGFSQVRPAGRRWGSVGVLVPAAWAVLFAAWVAWGWGGDALRLPIGDLAFLPVSLAGVAMSVRASRTDPSVRLPWLLIAASLASTLLGDATWSYLELVRHSQPFPSPADFFYLLFYPLLLAGLITMPGARRRRDDGLKFALDLATVVIGAAMIVWYFVLRPLAAAEQSGSFEAILTLAYPVGDLVMIFGAATVLLRRPDEPGRRAVAMLTAGVGLFVIADLAYGSLSIRGLYDTGDWPDALWMAAECAFVVAAAAQASRPAAGRSVRDERAGSPVGRPISVLPYTAILVGYGLLFVVARPAATSTVGGLLLGAIALTLLVVARQVTVIVENARLMERLHELVRTDDLTGLFNRRAFMDLAGREWARSQRYDRPICALAIDVDRFKRINDSLGHQAGDVVLATVARRIQLSMRVTDVVGRVGGDEFVCVLPDTDPTAVSALVERLRGLMSLPVETAGEPIAVTVSIGVAPADGSSTLAGMLERADAALYQAKENGRDCVRVLVAS